MRSDKTLLADLLGALVILIGMFYLMIITIESASSADFRPMYAPECRSIYQKTTKEVLGCD